MTDIIYTRFKKKSVYLNDRIVAKGHNGGIITLDVDTMLPIAHNHLIAAERLAKSYKLLGVWVGARFKDGYVWISSKDNKLDFKIT